MLHPINEFPEGAPHERKVLSERPTIHPTSRIHQCQIGSWTDIGPNCTMVETTFDDYSYLAGDAQIIYSQIGKFCSIASHVRINPGNHPMHRVTQHHMTYRRMEYGFADTDDDAFFAWRRSQLCVIGHDVWIGHGAIIMPGVSIGTGAVIGSAAVVTRDVGSYEIAVGVPARVIKKRFDDEVIETLLRSAWWDWDRATLEAHFDPLINLDAFLSTDQQSQLAEFGGYINAHINEHMVAGIVGPFPDAPPSPAA